MNEKMKGNGNRVLDSRKIEGRSRAEMARKSDLSEQTFKRVENGGKIAQQTRWKIVNGFNSLENKKRVYTEEYLFPMLNSETSGEKRVSEVKD